MTQNSLKVPPRRVVMDLDGVLLNMVSGALTLLNAETGTSWVTNMKKLK